MDFTDLQGFNKGKEMKKVAFTVFLILLSCQLALFSADIFTVAGSGTVAQVQQAIKAGADVNARDEDGETPLMYAAGYNTNPDVLSVLIKAGADLNARDYEGETPLMFAAENNTNPDVLSVLIEAGVDVNARDKDGVTPLMLAARHNINPEVLSVLIKAGANILLKDNSGKTTFDYAKNNSSIKGTKVYWELNDARYK
jgi:ankyrin repeat protein